MIFTVVYMVLWKHNLGLLSDNFPMSVECCGLGNMELWTAKGNFCFINTYILRLLGHVNAQVDIVNMKG